MGPGAGNPFKPISNECRLWVEYIHLYSFTEKFRPLDMGGQGGGRGSLDEHRLEFLSECEFTQNATEMRGVSSPVLQRHL